MFSAIAGAMFVYFVFAQSDFKEITIMADGSINPSNLPIQRNGNVYILTADIFGEITIRHDGITIDGKGHAMTGYGNRPSSIAHSGIQAFGQSHITLKNITVIGLDYSLFAGLNNSEIYDCDFIDCNKLSLYHGVNNTFQETE